MCQDLTLFNNLLFIHLCIMSDWLIRDPKALSLLFDEELYKVQSKSSPAVQKEVVEGATETLQFDYLGENNRFFLIVVNEPGQTYLEEANLEILLKILAAVRPCLISSRALNAAHDKK